MEKKETAAIYARKSKATEKGDSIENQINRCIALCELRGWDYEVFQDYDVSGATLDRPEFELMMDKIYKGELQYLVCYKLDRVSRSTGDFSNLIKELDEIDVAFISIKENFDLSTPMGRAMMMVTSVFAQLERETIAERVRDNMIDRAKMGKWNGGVVPFGFDTETKTIDYQDRTKKVSKLIIDEDESNVVTEFYDWYLESDGSVRGVTFRANESGYKTKRGYNWSNSQISRILQNPIYCIGDTNAYDYFKSSTEVNIVDTKADYNGSNGLMYYNRRKSHKNTTRERDESEWILAIGEHGGFIPGETFARVQHKLSRNKRKAPRSNQGIRSPLVGLVRCGCCESSMSVFASPKFKNKGYYNYFRCLTREQQSKTLCDNSNMRADKLEDLIISHITSLVDNKESLEDILETTNNDIEDRRVPLIAKRNRLQTELDNIDLELNNLVEALSKDILPEAVIKRKYKDLESKKIDYKKELEEISYELNNNYVETYDLENVAKHIKNFKATYEYLDFEQKKKLLNSIVKEVKVDKNKVMLTLYFLPGQDYSSQSDWSCTDMHTLAKSKTINIKCVLNDPNSLPETSVGERVHKSRMVKDFTIKELSELSCLSEETISNIENSITTPNISSIVSLCQPLDITINYILNTDELPENTPGEIIYKYRILSGLSISELAKECDLHKSTLKDYENDRLSKPETIKSIYKIVGYEKKPN